MARIQFLLPWAFVFLAVVLATPRPTAAQVAPTSKAASNTATSQSASSEGSAGTSDYMGSEVCKTCHEDIYNGWEKTPHWKTTLDTKGGSSKQGCESCHGPGAAHVAGGGDITKIFVFENHSPKEINDRCLTCHASDR